MDWRAGKTLRECSKFEHGWTLFVEDGEQSMKAFNSFKWKQEFDAEAERVTLQVNDPRSDSEFYEHQVNIAKTATVQKLKDTLASKFDIPTGAFYLKMA